MERSSYIDTFYARTLDEDERYPVLREVEEADVCVIGGGLAGINTALGLLERGKSVILVEQKRIGWGASGRNAGFVAKAYAAGFGTLARKLGAERARRVVDLIKDSRRLIRRRIADYGIDCGPVIDGVLDVSWHDRPGKVRREVEEVNRVFDFGFEYWPREKVRELCRTDRYYDGYFSPHDFQFNALRYLRGLAREVKRCGGRIYEDSPATDIARDGAGWIVRTPEGKARAKDIVWCCATYARGLDRRLENAVFPVQTYITVTRPIDAGVLASAVNTRHAIYELRFSSNYYRILPGNRLLWGGRVGLWAHPDDIARAMLHDMFEVYPQLRGHVEAETSWAGELAYAPHQMPQIGRIAPGYWYNTAYGGHGLAPTTAGGEIVAAAIAQGDKGYEAFAPFGLGLYRGGGMGRYVAQTVYLWWRLRDILGV